MRLELGLVLGSQMGHVVQSRDKLARAAEELRDRPELAARAASALAMPYWPGGRLAENLVWMERAEAAAAASGDPAVRTGTAANKATLLINVGAPEAADRVAELPRDSDDLASRQQTARGLCNSADAAVWVGYYEWTHALLAEGRDPAARNGAMHAERTGSSTELLLDWATGRWEGLDARARSLMDETGEPLLPSADALLVLGLLAMAKGEWGAAESAVAGSSPLNGVDCPVPVAAAAAGLRIRVAAAREDLDTAVREAERAWAALREKDVWVWASEPAPWAVQALTPAGRTEVAREWVEEFTAGVAGKAAPSSTAALAMCRGMIAEADGDAEDATALFREAADDFGRLPRPYDEGLARERAGHSLLTMGVDTTAAARELSRAVALFERIGASWDASRARAALRAHGRPTERVRGRPGYGAELSPREREVAALAAAGLTNRDIAATLHLSARTVEQHVARSLRKTGAGIPPGPGTVSRSLPTHRTPLTLRRPPYLEHPRRPGGLSLGRPLNARKVETW